MRYLILSDLHANWEALTAVLADAKQRYDTILCCGDVVGYGADPNRMTDWVRAMDRPLLNTATFLKPKAGE